MTSYFSVLQAYRAYKNGENVTDMVLSGRRLKTLPKRVAVLNGLVRLDISDNELSTLPPEIGNLVNLKAIHAANAGLHKIPLEIGKLKSLECLNLRRNSIRYLPSEFSNLKNLVRLVITKTHITDKSIILDLFSDRIVYINNNLVLFPHNRANDNSLLIEL